MARTMAELDGGLGGVAGGGEISSDGCGGTGGRRYPSLRKAGLSEFRGKLVKDWNDELDMGRSKSPSSRTLVRDRIERTDLKD